MGNGPFWSAQSDCRKAETGKRSAQMPDPCSTFQRSMARGDKLQARTLECQQHGVRAGLANSKAMLVTLHGRNSDFGCPGKILSRPVE
jgi:hypothetical protein